MKNIQTWLLVAAIGVITYLLIFQKNPDPNAGLEAEKKALQEQVKQLEEQEKEYQKNIDNLKLKDAEWARKDSLNDIELKNAEKRTAEERAKRMEAQKEREIAQKKLEEFRKNPGKIDDPMELIKDTKKRINTK